MAQSRYQAERRELLALVGQAHGVAIALVDLRKQYYSTKGN